MADDAFKFPELRGAGIGIDLTVQVDLSEFEATIKAFPRATNKAMMRTLNKVGKSAIGAGIKKAQTIYTLKRKRLLKGIHTLKAAAGRTAFIVTVSEGRIGLMNFSLRRGKRGLSVAVLRGKRTKIKGIVLKIPQKNADGTKSVEGVFMRTGDWKTPRKGSYKGKTSSRTGTRSKRGGKLQRELLVARRGPGPREIWSHKKVQAAFIAKVEERFQIVFEQELTFQLNRIPKGRRLR